jgi:hypothetical protein
VSNSSTVISDNRPMTKDEQTAFMRMMLQYLVDMNRRLDDELEVDKQQLAAAAGGSGRAGASHHDLE